MSLRAYKLILAFVFLSLSAAATDYTTIKAGNYSSGDTWQGGLVPPATLMSGDKISIYHTVNMDQNIIISSGTTLELMNTGTLNGTAGKFIDFRSGAFTNAGQITVDSFAITSGTQFYSEGDITTKTFSTNTTFTFNMHYQRSLSVQDAVYISNGALTFNGGTFQLPNGLIVLDGGYIGINSGGKFQGNNADLLYKGASTTTGAEIFNITTNGVEIAVDPGNTVTLNNIHGTAINKYLKLTSGTLDISNNILNLAPGCSYTRTNGAFSANSQSELLISCDTAINGPIKFAAGGNNLGKLQFANGSATAVIDNDLNIYQEFSIGDYKIDIRSHKITMQPGFSIFASGKKGWVITEHGGSLSAPIEYPSKLQLKFPIGTDKHKANITVDVKGVYYTKAFTVGVKSGVLADGNSGMMISATQPVVDATWDLKYEGTDNLDLELTTYWDEQLERNGFDRQNAYISHYTNATWDTTATSSATKVPSGTSLVEYYIKRNNITSLSPFSVFDNKTQVSVNEQLFTEANIAIAPNPTNNDAVVSMNLQKATTLSATITDVAGRTLYKLAATHYITGKSNITLPTAELPSGTYIITLINDAGQPYWSGRLIRQ